MSASSDNSFITRKAAVAIAHEAARAAFNAEIASALNRIADNIGAALNQTLCEVPHATAASVQQQMQITKISHAASLKDRLESWVTQNRTLLKKRHPGAARVRQWRATFVELFPFTQEDMQLSGQKQQPKAHKQIQNLLERRGGSFMRLDHDQYVLR